MMHLFWSDLLDSILNPLIWAIVVLLLGLFAKKPRRRKLRIILSFALLILFSNAFLIDEVLRSWEGTPAPLANDYSVAVVLGGGLAGFDSRNADSYYLPGSGRAMKAMELISEERIKKIIISGGSGDRLHPDVREARILGDFMLLFIDKEKVIIEDSSSTTFENAQFTSDLLKEMNTSGKILLITSAIHMPRAKACFRKQDLDFDVYPVGYHSGIRRWTLLYRFEAQSLLKWQALLHEILGMGYYKLSGKA